MSPTWGGMIRGLTFAASTQNILDVADKATGNAPDTDSPMVGFGGGEHPKESSPLYKFAGEIDAQTGQVSASATSPAIRSDDTVERLFNAVVLCEERNRR